MGLKSFLKRSFRTFLSLAFLMFLFPGFQIENKTFSLVIGAFLLTAINILVRPILKLIFLPLNLISFGLFRWVINVFSLVLLTFLVEEIRFVSYEFPGAAYAGFTVPAISFSALGSLICGSFLLSLIQRTIFKLLSDD